MCHLAMRVYSDNAQMTSKRNKNISYASRLRLVLLCSYHVLTSSMRYQSTYTRQDGLYYFVKYSATRQ